MAAACGDRQRTYCRDDGRSHYDTPQKHGGGGGSSRLDDHGGGRRPHVAAFLWNGIAIGVSVATPDQCSVLHTRLMPSSSRNYANVTIDLRTLVRSRLMCEWRCSITLYL
jgi:hypothetical protein